VDPDGFLGGLARAPSRVLLLDYDGTLAPFREARDEATPYPEVREAVGEILGDGATRVVVISGRTVEDLSPLLGLDPLPELWGTHGWERLRPGRDLEHAPLDGDAFDKLQRAAKLAREIAPHGRVEVKPASVAVHVRGMDGANADRLLEGVRSAWRPLLEDDVVEVRNFDGGAELRVRGRDKGNAVQEVLAEEPAAAAVAYLGDDLTDEDAFRALGNRGLSVLVRAEPRETSADVWIRPPGELLQFLRRWRAEAFSARRPTGTTL
jgi:trehalose-phosphatase